MTILFFFTDASTYDEGVSMSWEWDFDDGNVSLSQYPTHTFADGDWNVTLKVTDQYGKTDTTDEDITIGEV